MAVSTDTSVLLTDIIDLGLLAEMFDRRYIRAGIHPDFGHQVLEYTQPAQYERVWNDATKLCRGLIVSGDPFDPDTIVLARPFPKFANHTEHQHGSLFGPLPTARPFEVTVKMDGSLAIAYTDAAGLASISTRGGFGSPQAIAATTLWRSRYGDYLLPDGVTLLFEYVAPWNRVVVSYEAEELVLIAAIDIATGADVELPADWPGRTAARLDGFESLGDLVAHARTLDGDANQEGFVVRYIPDDRSEISVRTKIKLAEYLRLHRVVSNLTPRTIWAHMRSREPMSNLLELIPDESFEFVNETAADITARYDEIVAPATVLADSVRHLGSRREIAAAITVADAGKTTSGLAFALLDGHDVHETVFKLIEPAHTRGYQVMASGTVGRHPTY